MWRDSPVARAPSRRARAPPKAAPAGRMRRSPPRGFEPACPSAHKAYSASRDFRPATVGKMAEFPGPPGLYDRIGPGYTRTRRPDPRIEAKIHEALRDAQTVVNVGAGA